MNGLSRDDAIRMAREAGFKFDEGGVSLFFEHHAVRFANLVAAAEREACAALNAEMLAALYAVEVWLSSGEGTGFQEKVSAAINKAKERL